MRPSTLSKEAGPGAEQVWATTPGERRLSAGVYMVITLVLIVIGTLVGYFGNLNFPLQFGVNFFWPGIIVQQVGSIWFGAWGVIAGTIFPFFSNALADTPFLMSAYYIPANFLQAFLPAWAFRYFKADPRLRSGRDYLILLGSMILSSAFGALWSPLVVLRSFGLLDTEALPLYIWGWFGGNVVAGLVFNFILMQAFSALIIRSRLLVKRWWG